MFTDVELLCYCSGYFFFILKTLSGLERHIQKKLKERSSVAHRSPLCILMINWCSQEMDHVSIWNWRMTLNRLREVTVTP